MKNKDNLKHIVKYTNVFLRDKNDEIVELCLEYYTDNEKKYDEVHKKNMNVISDLIDEYSMNNDCIDLRFLDHMTDKVTFE